MIARFVTCMMILGSAVAVLGQEARDTAQTTIEGKQVTIEYGSPELKGRTLTDLMEQLPAHRIWRAGAGAVTTLETETDLSIGGKKVPAGKYSLYMHCPVNGDYTLVINSDLGRPLESYIPNVSPERAKQSYPHLWDFYKDIADKEVARISLKQVTSPNSEMLKYAFQPAGEGALLAISWGEQAWTIEFQPEETASSKLAVLWTSGDPDVAHNVAFMYTHTAKRVGWFDEVTLIVWGPSQRLLIGDKSLQDKVKAMQEDGVLVEACIACAMNYGLVEELKALGLPVRGMGPPLTNYLKNGWKVLTF